MSLTFYFAPMSIASGITEAVIAELGMPHDRIALDLSAGDHKKPDYLKINPNGKIPAIVHDGTAIWESSAITMYLGEVFDVDAKLYPAPSPQRGEAMKWIAWSNVTLAEPAIRTYQLSLLEKQENNAEEKSAIATDKAKTDLTDCLKILNDGLEGRSFLLGEYSLADTHLQGIVGWIWSMEIDLTSFSNIESWLQRCYERPAIAKLIKSRTTQPN